MNFSANFRIEGELISYPRNWSSLIFFFPTEIDGFWTKVTELNFSNLWKFYIKNNVEYLEFVLIFQLSIPNLLLNKIRTDLITNFDFVHFLIQIRQMKNTCTTFGFPRIRSIQNLISSQNIHEFWGFI